jgi:type IV secretory pathway VirB10-like protein
MELEKEPTPQSLPQPTGPIDPKTRITIFAIGAFIVVVALIGFLFFSRSGSQPGVIGPRQVASAPKPSLYQLNMQKEEDYERGKREGLQVGQAIVDGRTQPSYQPAQYQPTAQISRKEQEQDEYKKLLHDAAFSDNIVFIRGTSVGGSSRDGNPNPAVSSGNGLVSDHGFSGLPSLPGLENDRKTDGRDEKTLGQNVLPKGTIIYCALVNQLNGDSVGPVKVLVSNDVPFPGTKEIAIPQGSLILGEAQKVSQQFQQRLAVTFDTIQIGQTAGDIRQIDIKAPALDQEGAAALHDKTNNHYLSIFGAAGAVGAIGGLAQIGNGNYGGYGGIDPSTQIRNGISQSTAQSASQIMNRFLNRLPTVIIRPGTPIVVFLTSNLEIPNEPL